MFYEVEQLSVFVENKPSRLAMVIKILREADVKVKAFMIADAGDFGIIHLIVDDPKKGKERLIKDGFTVSTSKMVKVDHVKSDSLIEKVASILGRSNKNIRYAYGFVSEDGSLILRTEVIEEALKLLHESIY